MLSKPIDYSPPNSHPYKDLLNVCNLKVSSGKMEEILQNKKAFINSFETCPHCKAILSENLVKGQKCLFCQGKLEISANALKKQLNENKSFVLENKIAEKSNDTSTNVLIVICLDYSGSMNISYQPNEGSFGKEFLKNKKIPEEYKAFIKEYLEISRKELILVNLQRQLTLLFDSNTKYNYQVFVITFSNEIVMYGNGSKQNFSLTLASNNFDNLNECMKFGKTNATKVYEKSKNSNLQYLFQTLHAKEADGQTSLGPAIACGLGVVEALKPPLTQFYIFTDGVANLGIGDISKNTEEAKKTYSELADLGQKMGVVFHLFGFQDEELKMSILKELVERSQESKLERIKTPVLSESKKGKVLTYDEKDFEANLTEAMTASANTYGILTKMKVFSNAKVRFCDDSNLNVKEKKSGKATILRKVIGNISEDLNNISMAYKIVNEDEPVFVQCQIRFTVPSTGEKKFILANIKSEIQEKIELKDIDLKELNLILINDSLEKKDISQYLKLFYECKLRGENSTAKKAEKHLKEYIFGTYPSKMKENEKVFEAVEKSVQKDIEEDKIKELEKNKEKKPFQNTKVDNNKTESAQLNFVKEEESSDDEKTITKMKIKKKAYNIDKEEPNKKSPKKEEIKNEDDDDQTLMRGNISKKKEVEDDDEKTLQRGKMDKKKENAEEENTMVRKKIGKKEDNDEEENTIQKKPWGKKN